MQIKEDFIRKIDKYTEKGYLYNKEWQEINDQAIGMNKVLVNGNKINLEKIIRKKFKLIENNGKDISKLMLNEGLVRTETFEEIIDNTKKHKRLMNGNLFVMDDESIFENEIEQYKTATFINSKSILHKKKVLIKILKQEHTKDSDKISSFYESYEKIKNIEHPNVISGIDKWIDNTGLFYAIEYIEGETLSYWLKKNELNDEKEIKYIIQGIVKGLEYLHKNNIYLGNLNPNNIVVNKKGQVIITDMKLHGYEGEIKKTDNYITESEFIAPEQSKEGISAKADIYSLGKIISFIITRQTKDVNKIKDSLIPELLETAIKATKPNANERYKNVSEILKRRKGFDFKKITAEIGKNINYIYIALSGLLLLALSNRIIAMLGTNYIITKQIITIVGIFALIFSLMIIIFNILLKDEK